MHTRDTPIPNVYHYSGLTQGLLQCCDLLTAAMPIANKLKCRGDSGDFGDINLYLLDNIMMFYDLTVSGYSGNSGRRFISVSYGGANAYLALEMFRGKGEDVLHVLADRGVVLTGASAAKTLLERVYSVSDFEPANMITSPGYANGRFVLADGSVFGADADQAKIAFTKNQLAYSEAGTLEAWRDQVAALINDQHIPMMAVLLAFAAPLAAVIGRPMSRSIEFVASPSSSINVLPWLMASVTGAPTRQVVQFAQLASGRGGMPPSHNDLAVPVLGSDVLLMGEKPARRAAAFKNFLFPDHLGEQEPGGSGAAFGCLVLFSNEPLLGDDDAASELLALAAGQHVSLRVAPTEKYGVFDKLPGNCPGSAPLARRLVTRVSKHHGVALRHFLGHITEASLTDPTVLNDLVSRRISAFRKAAASNRSDHCESAITDTFALAYAAGWIARKIGIIPPNWRVGWAVIQCYRKDLYRPTPSSSFHDTLLDIAAGADVVQLGGDEGQTGTFDDTNVFIRTRERGNELLIRPSAIYAVIPDWDALVRLPSVKSTMVTEKGHMTVKRRLGDGQAQRVFCFKLPSAG